MSLCCPECFADHVIKDVVRSDGQPGRCTYCGADREQCVDARELFNLFEPVVALYTRDVEFKPIELMREGEGRWLAELLDDEWVVFETEHRHDLLADILDGEVDPREDFENLDRFTGADAEHDAYLAGLWNIFCNELIVSNRFFLESEPGPLTTAISLRVESLNANETLYRAREGIRQLREMGAPPPEKTPAGRANPVGIPYLYLASDETTALEECGSGNELKTVAHFSSDRILTFIDLSPRAIGSPFAHGDHIAAVLSHAGFLTLLGRELSRPVDRGTVTTQYLPSQYLCEFIKAAGYDGVRYESHWGPGYNYAFFDPAALSPTGELQGYRPNIGYSPI